MKESNFTQSEITDMANLVHEALEGRYSLTGEELFELEAMLVECQELKEAIRIEDSRCECKKEWLLHTVLYDQHPYGDNVQYDECRRCGKKHNFKSF